MTQPVNRDALVSFVDELREALPAIRAGLTVDSASGDEVNEARRLVHSLNGSAALLGLQATVEIVAPFELAVEELATGEATLDGDVRDNCGLFCQLLEDHASALLTDDSQPGFVTEAIRLSRRLRELPESGDAADAEAAQLRVEPDLDTPSESSDEVDSDFDVDLLDMDQIDAFTEEAADHIREVALLLTGYAKDSSDDAPLAEVRRRIHSLKGSAGTIGFNDVAHLAHRVEDILQQQLDGDVEGSEELTGLYQTAVDTLEELIQGLTGPEACTALFRRFDEVLGIETIEEAPVAVETAKAETTVKPAVTATAGDASAVLTAFRPTDEQLAELAKDISDRDSIAPELMEVFNEEAEDHLRNIYACFGDLEKDIENVELLQSVRRSAHTLKGAAGAVGLRVVTHLAHRMEDLLDRLYEGGIPLTHTLLTLLYSSTDALQDLVNGEFDRDSMQVTVADLYAEFGFRLSQRDDALTAGSTVETEVAVDESEEKEVEEVVADSTDETDEAVAEEAPVVATTDDTDADSTSVIEVTDANVIEVPDFNVAPLKVADAEDKAAQKRAGTAARAGRGEDSRSGQVLRVPVQRLDALTRLVGELIINRTAFEQRMADFGHFVEEMQLSIERLRNTSHQLEAKYGVNLLGGGRRMSGDGASLTDGLSILSSRLEEFDDLEFDRYTEFHLLARSLAETGSDLNTVSGELRNLMGDFDQLLTRQGRLSRDTQDRLMRIRMVPLATLATKLHRTVRVVANQQDKLIDLEISGEYVELDKFVLEEMADPLLHLLRNAADHGIESTEDRAAADKPERGTIRVDSFYQGTQVVVEICDDGRGLNVDAIRAKAIELNLITAQDAETMKDEDLYPFIFQPGFTTAKQLSEVSGRGVGMDIVRDKVSKLKGTVSVSSEAGQGTTFTVRLPMTLAVTRALLIKSRQQTFAVPMQGVLQILRIDRDQVEKLDTEPVLRVGGRTFPLVNLADRMNLHGPTDESSSTIPVLIINAGDNQIALAAEQILSGRDIVVKTLGNHLQNVDGLIGATLMGDGTVVPILDVAWLVGSSDGSTQRSSGTATPVAPRRKLTQTNTIMVVDDSVSVRRVMTNLLRSAGWNVIDAKDGVDALEVLQTSDRQPDLFLLDIEMPRMDGYELLSSLRSQDSFRSTPIVMVTSRAGAKHRQKALDLGATDYVIKPYQDEQLLGLVRELMAVGEAVVSG